MKPFPSRFHLLCALALSALASNAAPLGTAFTYQGRLADGTNAANNLYDLDFALFDVPTGGSQLGLSVTYNGFPVSNGLFTVELDLGASPFTGDARWLQIQVRTNGGRTTPWTPLTPRQALTPAPYALYAPSAGSAVTASNVAPFSVTAGSIADGTITAGKLASGQVVKSLNGLFDAVTLSAGTNVTLTPSGNDLKISATPGTVVTNAGWGIAGNSGTTAANFLGTLDGQPLELRVNGQRALRLEPGAGGAPNVVGGFSSNSVAVDVAGATIAGGGSHIFGGSRIEADYGSIGGGFFNTLQTDAYGSTISGGFGNWIQTNSSQATIGGGHGNAIQQAASASTIGGGNYNLIQTGAWYSTIGGGDHNVSQNGAWYSTIGGGELNTIQTNAYHSSIGGGGGNSIGNASHYATVPGGANNYAAGQYGLAAGRRAKALHRGTFAWADATDADHASTGDNQFCIRASGGVQLSPATSLYCGSQTRQMFNLYSTNYGIGVQASTLYFRTDGGLPDNGFAWYRGGSHNDGQNNSGGGATLMTLNKNGLYVNGTIVSLSDRNLKENFAAVSPREVLDKVAALPISRWNFKGDAATPHVGPMAQDFHAAFGLGTDDRHIATVDADGVALAAIQGLNQKLEAKNAALAQEMAELKTLVKALAEKVNGGGQ